MLGAIRRPDSFPASFMVTKNPSPQSVLPNDSLSESQQVDRHDAALRARITELETLCAEVYIAAVELGLPQPLLNRLWTVGTHGATPQAFDVEMPSRLAAPAPRVLDAPALQTARFAQLPDIRLTDRPAARDESRAKAPQAELKPLPERRRVMVVDDDAMMLEVLERILQRENYELITASSGAEALQKASGESDLDLLITDYAMPGMKGRELAEKIRERWTSIKVLYQTGFSDMLFENRVELEDGSAFLEKPFTARGLREAVRLILFGVINPQ
jgi:CheY-like chemotaxis protein